MLYDQVIISLLEDTMETEPQQLAPLDRLATIHPDTYKKLIVPLIVVSFLAAGCVPEDPLAASATPTTQPTAIPSLPPSESLDFNPLSGVNLESLAPAILLVLGTLVAGALLNPGVRRTLRHLWRDLRNS
jgi:hypothetical protein